MGDTARFQLLFATTNPGKLKELDGLLRGALRVASLADFPGAAEVEEDQDTFEGNAAKKARAYAQATGLPALADDSGLCVEALGGRPGVQSARYAEDELRRNQKLLLELKDVPVSRRAAEFRCALCLAMPGGPELIEVGRVAGVITHAPRGTKGFGYDPVFEIPSLGKTLAELTREEKSALSHRGEAFRKMLHRLLALAGS